MRIDKLTTKFQEALSEAQSIALVKDNQYIEPAHVMLAMLRDSRIDCSRPRSHAVPVSCSKAVLKAWY